jgi:hypothetical protein
LEPETPMDSKQVSVYKKNKTVQYIKAFISKTKSKASEFKSEMMVLSKANLKKEEHVDMGLML